MQPQQQVFGKEAAEEGEGKDEACHDEGGTPSVFAHHHQKLGDAGDEERQDDGGDD